MVFKLPLQKTNYVKGAVLENNLSFRVRKQCATKAGELIHADVVGPMHQKSLGNIKYFCV